MLLLVQLSLSAGLVQAQVKINEVNPQPQAGEAEWVELLNTASTSADLSGWVLEDVLSSPKTIFTFGQLILLPNQFTIASFSGQLNNSADGVTLKNHDGAVLDQMNFESSTLDLSWSLNAEGKYLLTNPSPGLVNTFPTPSPSPAPLPSPDPTPMVTPTPVVNPNNSNLESILELQITRVSTCPESGSEWLEWFNPTSSDLAVTLEISDLQHNRLPLFLQISSQQKAISTLTRNIFNNAGDGLKVIYQDQQLLELFFPGCEKIGTVYGFTPDSPWPHKTVLPNPEDQTKVGEIKPNVQLVLPTALPSSKIIKAGFAFPSNVINNLDTSQGVAGTASAVPSSTESGQVLGQTASDPPQHSLLAATLVISGGFFWIGLGIIELYGEQSPTAFTLV